MRKEYKNISNIVKKVAILIFIMILAVSLYSESRDISTLSNGNLDEVVGAYISLDTKLSQVHDKIGVFLGGRLAFILDNNFSFGVSGYGLLPEPEVDIYCLVQGHDPQKHSYLNVLYGGLFFEYNHLPTNLLNISANTLIGVGGIGIRHNKGRIIYIEHNKKFFLVIEPTLEFNLNIHKYFKTALGVGYRFTSNTTLKDGDEKFASSSVIEGFSINLGFKLGSF